MRTCFIILKDFRILELEMKRSFNIVLVLFSAFMFFSCGSTKKIAPKAELFSNVWVSNSKMSAQDCGKFYTSPELGRFSSIEVEFKKTSGSETGTFGLVFDYSSQKDGICSDYIRFEINTLGEYAIYSFDGTKYKDFVDSSVEGTAYFSKSSAIVQGLSSLNTLKVDFQDGTYSFFINGTKVLDNVKSSSDAKKGFMAFFSVAKPEEESLPDTPVSVSYRFVNAAR